MAAYLFPPTDPELQKAAGKKIRHLSKMASASDSEKLNDVEWKKFMAAPGLYLTSMGYQYKTKEANGQLSGPKPIPPGLIQPLFETQDKWYLSIPHVEDIDESFTPPDEASYGSDLDIFLARYLMRHCR